jgi:carboxyl-terminal processing protease
VINNQSASATEMVADTLRDLDNVTLIGERSAGKMLSQSFFDVSDGFMLVLPIANYISLKHGQIEGIGVPVDIEVKSSEALETAIHLAKASNK